MTFHLPYWEPTLLPDFIRAHARECLALERTYKIDLEEPRARAVFIVYRLSLQLDDWAAEIQNFPQVHRILFERLQAEREYFAAVFHALTQGRIVADKAYLDRVFTPANLGSGRQSTSKNSRPPGASAQYELWTPWEREEFARAARRLNLPRLYFPFGYDFSFVARDPDGNRSWFADMLS
jgi:hypothetical protein